METHSRRQIVGSIAMSTPQIAHLDSTIITVYLDLVGLS